MGSFGWRTSSANSLTLPNCFALGPSYPNPYHPATIIPYHLLASSAVRLEVFELLGQRLATLVDAEQSEGSLCDAVETPPMRTKGQAVGAGVLYVRGL